MIDLEVHPQLDMHSTLLDSGCGVALLNSGCGVALLASSFGLALLGMVPGPCSATTLAAAMQICGPATRPVRCDEKNIFEAEFKLPA